MQPFESVQSFANSQIAPQAVLPIIKSGWCLPTVLNFILLILGLFTNLAIYVKKKSDGKDVSLIPIFASFIPGLILVTVLFLLCRYDHANWAWAVLIIQLILIIASMAILIAGFAMVVKKLKKEKE